MGLFHLSKVNLKCTAAPSGRGPETGKQTKKPNTDPATPDPWPDNELKGPRWGEGLQMIVRFG